MTRAHKTEVRNETAAHAATVYGESIQPQLLGATQANGCAAASLENIAVKEVSSRSALVNSVEKLCKVWSASAALKSDDQRGSPAEAPETEFERRVVASISAEIRQDNKEYLERVTETIRSEMSSQENGVQRRQPSCAARVLGTSSLLSDEMRAEIRAEMRAVIREEVPRALRSSFIEGASAATTSRPPIYRRSTSLTVVCSDAEYSALASYLWGVGTCSFGNTYHDNTESRSTQKRRASSPELSDDDNDDDLSDQGETQGKKKESRTRNRTRHTEKSRSRGKRQAVASTPSDEGSSSSDDEVDSGSDRRTSKIPQQGQAVDARSANPFEAIFAAMSYGAAQQQQASYPQHFVGGMNRPRYHFSAPTGGGYGQLARIPDRLQQGNHFFPLQHQQQLQPPQMQQQQQLQHSQMQQQQQPQHSKMQQHQQLQHPQMQQPQQLQHPPTHMQQRPTMQMFGDFFQNP
ncbi:unnamed protein product [Ectocarpus sp. 12 AP-2014]